MEEQKRRWGFLTSHEKKGSISFYIFLFSVFLVELLVTTKWHTTGTPKPLEIPLNS